MPVWTKSAQIAVTCLVTAGYLITGLVVMRPIAMAPGMGLNAFYLCSCDREDFVAALGQCLFQFLFVF